MPRSNFLALRAARSELALSSTLPVPSTFISSSQPSPSSNPPTQTIERCRHCLVTIPLGGSLRHHIAATLRCREAEAHDVRTGRADLARQRAWRREQEEVEKEQEKERERDMAQNHNDTRQPFPEGARRAPTPEGEPTDKRRRVTVEDDEDPDAPNVAGPSRLPAPGPSWLPTPGPSRLPTPGPSRLPMPNTSGASQPPRAGQLSGDAEARSSQRTSQGVPLRQLPRGSQKLRRWKGMLVEEFHDLLAGAPISNDRVPKKDLEKYMKSIGKLADPQTFEVPELLYTSGLKDSDKERHLKSSLYRGRTPWDNLRELVVDLDALPHGPEFTVSEIADNIHPRPRVQYLVRRNALDVMRDLFSNSMFDGNFAYGPAKYWTRGRRRERVYVDTRSGTWWWDEQEKLHRAGKRAATIAPIILASDETHLSVMCGGQTAYPVYMSLGNITKHWRRKPSKRAMVLLGYLPTDPFDDIANDDERRRLKVNLVHRCMEEMLRPLKEVWEDGVDMWCPDGRLRRVFPRMAAYLADWPEQNLHTCTSIASCPICRTLQKGRGDWENPSDPRNRDETLDALYEYFDTHRVRRLKDLGLKRVWPWWAGLPDVDLHKNVVPDVLHQLYQGVFKSHLYRWLKFIIGMDTLDERFASMPRAEGLTHFPNGVSVIKQWTGRESKEILRQILPAVLGDLRPEEAHIARSLIEFIFRTHASSMSETDLGHLEHELDTFHKYKDHLIAIGFYENNSRFDRIPKLHSLSHYVDMIRALGTPDGYSTEVPEHLHIEYAKVPWRASNKVRPMPQMLKYIQRQEAIRIHRAYLNEYLGIERELDDDRVYGDEDNVGCTASINSLGGLTALRDGWDEVGDTAGEERTEGDIVWEAEADAESGDDDEGEVEPVAYPNPQRHMAVNPTKRNMALRDVARSYQAPNLQSAITDFLVRRCNVPEYNVMLAPANRLQVWHRLYLYHEPLPFAPFDPLRRDVVRASAPVLGPGGRVQKEGVWDVALYLERPNQRRSNSDNTREKHGIQRYRAGRVRAFFSLPGHIRHYYPGQLAYVEVFRPFEAIPASPYGRMHSTGPELDSRDRRRTIVIPATEIVLACHLVPKYNELDPELALTPFTDLLSIGRHFWLNHYYTHYFYQLVQHWQRKRPTLRDRLLAHVR